MIARVLWSLRHPPAPVLFPAPALSRKGFFQDFIPIVITLFVLVLIIFFAASCTKSREYQRSLASAEHLDAIEQRWDVLTVLRSPVPAASGSSTPRSNYSDGFSSSLAESLIASVDDDGALRDPADVPSSLAGVPSLLFSDLQQDVNALVDSYEVRIGSPAEAGTQVLEYREHVIASAASRDVEAFVLPYPSGENPKVVTVHVKKTHIPDDAPLLPTEKVMP